MKKIHFNIIIFVLVALLVIGGWFSEDMFLGLKNTAKALKNDRDVTACIQGVDNNSKKYSWRYLSVDVHSLSYLVTNTRSLKKGSDTVVRMDNNYLAYDYATLQDNVIEQTADYCAKLSDFCKNNDTPFMYIYAPQKQYFGTYPTGNENTNRSEGERFVSALRKRNVNTLSLAEKMIEQGKEMEDCYFITDHHWTPETGFWATGEICQKLNTDYGFNYDSKVTDINNYNVKVYKNWFLGSQGKKTGRFFTPLGVDDISLITPKFATDLSVKDSTERTGEFEDTVIIKEKIETKSLHQLNPYAAYSGGDFAIQTIENNNNPTGEKILIIRDSYACSVTPFLSLTTKSMHILDLRTGLHGSACVNSVSQYITQYQPDYVLVLYSGLSSINAGTGMSLHFDFK